MSLPPKVDFRYNWEPRKNSPHHEIMVLSTAKLVLNYYHAKKTDFDEMKSQHILKEIFLRLFLMLFFIQLSPFTQS